MNKASELMQSLTDLERRPADRRYTAQEYDLAGFAAWLETIGRPQEATRWIHIAGTKGKGSTAAMTEAILRAAGRRTGLFTSPHLSHYGERFRINGQSWTMDEFEKALEMLAPHFDEKRLSSIEKPHGLRTVFEVLTALAFVEFKEAAVDFGVLEVGLGGRLDCTNVIGQPAVTVITPIGLDHVAILGDTIEKIAAEKGGIIKPEVPVVVFRPQDELQEKARRVIEQRAEELAAPVIDPWDCTVVERAVDRQVIELVIPLGPLRAELPVLGDFQAQNFALASRACAAVLPDSELLAAIQDGGKNVRWKGRLEIKPGKPPLILDGAHCPLSARALGGNLKHIQYQAPAPTVLLWGMQRDKMHERFIQSLFETGGGDPFSGIICYEVPGGRGADPNLLARVARRCCPNVRVVNDVIEASERAFEAAMIAEGSVLACGTLYTLAKIAARHDQVNRVPLAV